MRQFAIIALLGFAYGVSLQSNTFQPEIDLEGTGELSESIIVPPCPPNPCPPICGTCTIECGPCPHLQDAGIVPPCQNFGKLNYHAAQADVSGTSREEIYPNVKLDSATATNTCGLSVAATKTCGNVCKHKHFCINGNIDIDETDTLNGCDAERVCSDARYTATKQHLTTLDDADYCPEFGCLCKEAEKNVDHSNACCV